MDAAERALLVEYLRRFETQAEAFPFESLEELLTSKEGFGLTTATPLQRAICRIIDGKPLGELATHKHVRAAVGDVSKIDGIRPLKVVWLAGIRGAKSLMAAAVTVWAGHTVDLSPTRPGEDVRHSTISTEKDLAKVILSHLKGALENQPQLKPILAADPTAEGCLLNLQGRTIEARIVAGAKSGRSVVARWSAGFTADEAPRMASAAESPINLEDTETAVEGRLLPGAQILEIGSPWAPFGPVYETWKKHWRKPTPECVVICARGDWLNPYWWTKERQRKLKESNPTAYQTDFLAKFADVSDTLYPQAILDACTRHGEPGAIEAEAGHEYSAAIDPATRGNAWTLTIGDRVRRPMGERDKFKSKTIKRIVFAKQWQGTPQEPLRPREVFAEIGPILYGYGLDWCYTDQWSADSMVDIAEEEGIDLIIEDWTSQGKILAFGGFRDAMADESISLPDDPILLSDFRRVRRVVTRTGLSIDLPHTGDGRHCDYAPAAVRTLTRWIEEDEEQAPEEGTAERTNWEAQERQRRAAEDLEAEAEHPWWDRRR